MKKFDFEHLTATKLLGITPENFRPIYLPLFVSLGVVAVGVVLFLISNNILLFKVIFGLSGVILGLSGMGQIRLKEVPGFPRLQGGCAVAFGIVFLLFFLVLGIGFIFLE